MPTFHLTIDRSDYQSENIADLEPLLADFLAQENMGKITKTKNIPFSELSPQEHYDLTLEETHINNKPIKRIHIYNHLTCIIETE